MLIAGLLAAILLPAGGCKGGFHAIRAIFHHRRSKSKPNTTDYADNVADKLESGKLSSLRWADYSDYQPEVQQFYDDRNFELAWTRDGKPTPAATQMIQLFTDAASKGLNAEDYDASRWPQRLTRLAGILKKNDTSDAAQDDVAEFDVAMTISAMRFVSDLHVGRINPQALNFDIDVPKKRAELDLPAFVGDQLVDADDAAGVVATVEPKNPIYAATEQALPRYLDLARQEAAAPLEPLPAVGKAAVSAGGTYAGMAGLAQRLEREGDGTFAPPGNAYTPQASDAVKHFQSRHGITPDGRLNDATIAALNVPMSERVQQMDDALERWRWLPDIYQQPRVLVNLPEFLLRAYDADHHLDFTMRVVDGEANGHDTPTFVRLMRYVVFRPYWNLPTSIVKKEIVGHLEKSGMGYLDSHGYELTTGSGTVVSGASVADVEHLRYAVRQRPGPKNSLGLVKFLFPNEYDVYMHSTPELNLFNLTRRDRSHGCVRLQHADQMAQWVLSNDNPDGGWDLEKVDGMMNDEADNNTTVNLKTPLAVAILYLTAIVEEDGSVDFFNDMYGYDKELEAALAKGRPYPKGEMKINPKLTPGETV